VRNPAENDWLVRNFAQSEDLWIGYSDQNLEGTWEWVSGETTTGGNWAQNQPDNDWIGQHWAYLIRGNSSDPSFPPGFWDDAYYFTTMRGIVEVVPNPNAPSLVSSDPLAGQLLTLTVSQVSPGSIVQFAWSSLGGGPIANQYGLMELTPPIHLMNAQIADAQGVVVKTGQLGQFLNGYTVWLQAWSSTDNLLSNGIKLDVH